MKRRIAIACLVTVFQILQSAAFAEHGRTVGTFAVSPGGGAAYSIPLWVPPGTRGVQPTLSLDYNSQQGNGLAGFGWRLGGLPAIERCAKSKGQDGTLGNINGSYDDPLCLEGNRLRRISGVYGQHLSVYQTELATFARVTSFGTTGSGPTYFRVEGKNGLKFEFGFTDDARVHPDANFPTPVRWMLNKVWDHLQRV